jgi:hypothetical protein
MLTRRLLSLAAFAVFLAPAAAEARGNRPCSGKKGGVSHCSGSKFICNDGSMSASKRSCGGSDGDASSGSGGSIGAGSGRTRASRAGRSSRRR